MQALRIVTANDHRKGIFEAQRLGDRKVKTFPILLLNAMQNRSRIAARLFI